MDHDPGSARLLEGRAHHIHRRWAAAEQAYHEAIAAGRVDGWLFLGLLLQPWPGREQQAKAAFHAAMADDDPETSSRAASELGFMLARLDGDQEGAREYFAFAAEHGSGRTWVASTVALGHLSAADGDRQAVTEAFRSVAAELSRARNVEFGDDELRRAASAMAGLVLRPGWRRLIRRYRAATYRGLRIRRRLFPGGWRARRS